MTSILHKIKAYLYENLLARDIVINNPSELIVKIPELSAELYIGNIDSIFRRLNYTERTSNCYIRQNTNNSVRPSTPVRG